MPCDRTPRKAQACPPPSLTIQASVCGGSRTIHLTGELDMATARELDAVIQGVVLDASELLIDLDGLTFVDSSGLVSILACRESCRRSQTDFRLTPGKPHVRRLFELSGLRDELTFINAGEGRLTP